MAGDSIDVQLGEMVLQERVAKLEAQNEKLRAFLDHYKTVERAAGAISVQYGMSPDDPFDLLRGMAQTQRCGLHSFAKQVLVNRGRFPDRYHPHSRSPSENVRAVDHGERPAANKQTPRVNCARRS